MKEMRLRRLKVVIRRLKVAGERLGSNVPIKLEEECLAEDFHPPRELLPSIKIEKDPFHTDAEANAVQEFTPIPQTDEYLKTELILDEEWIDNIDDLEANCKQNVQADSPLVGAGLSVKKSETGELSSPSDSPKRSRSVEVHMPSKQLGEAQSITPCPTGTDDDTKNPNHRSNFLCEKCGSSYARKSNLKTHMLRKHCGKAVPRFECEVCSRSLSTKKDLTLHLRIHSRDSNKDFCCDLCGKTFYEIGYLNKHKKIHTSDKYACKVCGHLFTQRENLKSHMVRRQHFDKPQRFTPQSANNDVISDEEFMAEGNYKDSVPHAEETQQPTLAGNNEKQTGVNTAVDSVTCGVCHNSYPGKFIKAHMRLKHNDKTYKCQFCSRSLKTKASLKTHLRIHSKNRRREFACDLCGKTFYKNNKLNSHKKIHTGDRYVCKVCGDLFTRKDNLKKHLIRRQHFDKTQQFTPQSSNNDAASMTRDDRVTCEVCHNSYPGKLIKAHMHLKHKDEIYKCQIYSRSYSSKGYLKMHLRLHSKDRNREFTCELCGKTFYHKKNLNTHLKTHSRDRYPCKVCGDDFTREKSLKRHMARRKHFEKPQQ